MTEVQQIVTLAIPAMRSLPPGRRIDLLETAAQLLRPGQEELAALCEGQAVCLRNAEKHQLKMEAVLLSK